MAKKKTVVKNWPAPKAFVEAISQDEIKLDLGAGQNPREGYQGVDRVANPAKNVIAMDIFKYPWPYADNSVTALHASHFIEHIPMIEVDGTGKQAPFGQGQDALFRFFDECWRVLKPDGLMELIWPCSRSDRAFWDPTHRRFLPAQFLMYLNETWRKNNALDHYNVHCNFIDNVNFTIPQEVGALSDEVRARHFNNYWNSIIDFHAKLRAIKPGSVETGVPSGPFALPNQP